MDNFDRPGVWRTINGRRIFIPEGTEDISSLFRNSNREYKSTKKIRQEKKEWVQKNKGELDASARNLEGTRTDTLGIHTDSDGKLRGNREDLHDEIITDHFLDKNGNELEPVNGQATFTMMGGGPASGKSSVLATGMVNIPEGSVEIDPDGIKGKLPEYKELVKLKNDRAAAFAHEESSALGKQTMKLAMENKYNTLLDGTGDGSLKSITSKIKQARDNGMRVEGVYVTCDTDEAVRRANERAQKTGRFVSENVIRKTHSNVSRLLPEVAHKFDSVAVYDTNGSKVIKIAEGGNGKPLVAIKGYEKEFEAFLAKAK